MKYKKYVWRRSPKTDTIERLDVMIDDDQKEAIIISWLQEYITNEAKWKEIDDLAYNLGKCE